MLWSQFSAIFANFLRKNRRFSQKLAAAWAKNANIFARFFGENILKIITSVPGPLKIVIFNVGMYKLYSRYILEKYI
jgi:hypothetical protein